LIIILNIYAYKMAHHVVQSQKLLAEKQYAIYEQDCVTLPKELKFTHNGIDATITRHKLFKHLNGYIDISTLNLTKYQIEQIDLMTHGGITYNSEGTIGFDCSHVGDFMPSSYELSGNFLPNEKYRTSEWVEKHIMYIIDEIPNIPCFAPQEE